MGTEHKEPSQNIRRDTHHLNPPLEKGATYKLRKLGIRPTSACEELFPNSPAPCKLALIGLACPEPSVRPKSSPKNQIKNQNRDLPSGKSLRKPKTLKYQSPSNPPSTLTLFGLAWRALRPPSQPVPTLPEDRPRIPMSHQLVK